MANDSLGLIELTSIASGFLACDSMLKAADVSLVLSRSICSGKYMVMVRGDVSSVEAAVQAGVAGARFSVIDSFVIPNLHESGVSGDQRGEQGGGAGSAGDCGIVLGGEPDRRRGRGGEGGERDLIEIRLAMALGGKAFVTMTGNVAAVQSAVDAAASMVGQKGMLVNKVVIPSPRPELLNEMI